MKRGLSSVFQYEGVSLPNRVVLLLHEVSVGVLGHNRRDSSVMTIFNRLGLSCSESLSLILLELSFFLVILCLLDDLDKMGLDLRKGREASLHPGMSFNFGNRRSLSRIIT